MRGPCGGGACSLHSKPRGGRLAERHCMLNPGLREVTPEEGGAEPNSGTARTAAAVWGEVALVTVVTLVARALLDPVLGRTVPYVTFYPGIAWIALRHGW